MNSRLATATLDRRATQREVRRIAPMIARAIAPYMRTDRVALIEARRIAAAAITEARP